ncbi:MAG: hypothetical protein H7Y38_19355 [Armatimonadetes bacterium]|nr:hypothetical protein [Armatimonadota bacterium]
MDKTADGIVIACGTDDGYAMQMLIMLQTLVRSQPEKIALTIYMIDGGILPQNKAKIDALLTRRDGVKYHWLAIENNRFHGMMENGWIKHLTQATLLRLLLPELLPDSVKRVLYLDSDVVIQGNLSPFASMDFENNFLIGVPDLNVPLLEYIAAKDPTIPADKETFNAGIIVMNLTRLRETGKIQRVFDRMREQPTWSDQEGLNAVFHGEWKRASFLYNLQSNFMWLESATDSRAKNEVREYGYDRLWKDAVVFHFTTGIKPWGGRWKHPYRLRYEQLMRDSGWFSAPEWAAWKVKRYVQAVQDRMAFAQKK